MSSPPLNKSCNRAGLFKRPVRSSASSRWPQALVQNPAATPPQELRLGSLAILVRGPRQPAANELGGGSVRHVLSPSSNAWPSRRRQARPRHIPHPTSLRTSPRAEQRCFMRPSPSTSLGRGKWLRLPDQNWLCIPDRYQLTLSSREILENKRIPDARLSFAG